MKASLFDLDFLYVSYINVLSKTKLCLVRKSYTLEIHSMSYHWNDNKVLLKNHFSMSSITLNHINWLFHVNISLLFSESNIVQCTMYICCCLLINNCFWTNLIIFRLQYYRVMLPAYIIDFLGKSLKFVLNFIHKRLQYRVVDMYINGVDFAVLIFCLWSRVC